MVSVKIMTLKVSSVFQPDGGPPSPLQNDTLTESSFKVSFCKPARGLPGGSPPPFPEWNLNEKYYDTLRIRIPQGFCLWAWPKGSDFRRRASRAGLYLLRTPKEFAFAQGQKDKCGPARFARRPLFTKHPLWILFPRSLWLRCHSSTCQ